MNKHLERGIRAVGGLIVLGVIVMLLSNWWGDYRSAAGRTSSGETSATVNTTATPSASSVGKTGSGRTFTSATITSGKHVVIVLIEGLNFRIKPEPDATAIRPLKKGESLKVIGQRPGWYRAVDDHEVQGWVSANPAYTTTRNR